MGPRQDGHGTTNYGHDVDTESWHQNRGNLFVDRNILSANNDF